MYIIRLPQNGYTRFLFVLRQTKRHFDGKEYGESVKMKKIRKAFTITELVIVIAVIAILAAVLIPTFTNVIRRAKISSDTQTVASLNTALPPMPWTMRWIPRRICARCSTEHTAKGSMIRCVRRARSTAIITGMIPVPGGWNFRAAETCGGRNGFGAVLCLTRLCGRGSAFLCGGRPARLAERGVCPSG